MHEQGWFGASCSEVATGRWWWWGGAVWLMGGISGGMAGLEACRLVG